MLAELILACAPNVAPETMQWVIQLESRGDALAININTPDGPLLPQRKPASAADAAELVRPYLNRAGYSVDVGLMQVNSNNFRRLGLTVEEAFEVCPNLHAGAAILTEAYQAAVKVFGATEHALLAALSKYNTGSLTNGFSNGYVSRYLSAWGSAPQQNDHRDAAFADTRIPDHPADELSHARDADPNLLNADFGMEPNMAQTKIEAPIVARDEIPRDVVISQDMADFRLPGVVVELDQEEADHAGVMDETALTFSAAWDSSTDGEGAVPAFVAPVR